jgi:autotransporter-associated beta strand protein
LSAPIVINSNTTQFQVLTGSATQAGSISQTGGARPFEKIGAGTLVLSGTNTFTGPTMVTGGILSLLGGAAMSDISEVTIAAGATLSLGASETIGSLAGAGSISLGSNVLTTGTTNASTLFSGVIAGSGGKLVKTGSGLLTLSGNNTFTGGIDLMQGGIRLASNTAAGTGPITTFGSVIDYADGVSISSPIVINSNTTQFQVLTGSATQAGAISQTGGARPFEKIGAGTLVLSGANTFSGTTSISAGTLGISGGNALLDSARVSVASGATFRIQTSETIDQLTGNGNLLLNSGAVLTMGGTNASWIFGGTSSGAGGIIKSGTGEFSVAGPQAFTGNLAVNGGSLKVAPGGSFAGLSSLTVGNGAKLDLGSNATITTATLSMAEGATLEAALTPTAAPRITVSSGANLAGTFVANIDPAAFAAAGQARYEYNGIITGAVSGTFGSVVLNDPSGVFEAKPAYNSFDLVIEQSAAPANTLAAQASDTFSPSVSERTNSVRSPGCTVAGDTWCFRRYAQAPQTVATDAVSDIDPFAWAETGLRDAGSFSLWGRGIGAWSQMDGRGASPDSRQATYGLILGADQVINKDLLVGFASQYTRADTRFDSSLSSSSIEAVQAGVYMSYGDVDAHLDASVSVVGSQARTRRAVGAGADQVAHARFQSVALLASAEVGTVFETADLFRIEPLVGFSFAIQDPDDYRERNDGGPALIMSPDDTLSLRTSLGARISKVYDLGDRKFVPQFRLQWKHEALDVRPTFTAAVDTAPTTLFDIKGTSRARDFLDFGLSGTMPVTGRITGYVDLSGLVSEDTRAGAVSVGARATW